jgi:hypothetical protein
MNKKAQMLMGILMLLLLSVGCARQTVVETKTLSDGTDVVTKTTDHGFWESENLAGFYQFENNRVDKNADNVAKKIDSIQKQAMLGIQSAQTQTEKVLISTLAMVQLGHIPTTPNPSGQQAPKTAVDMLDRNLLGLLNLGVSAWGVYELGNNGGDSYQDSPSIVNSGAGDVFFMSDNNKNPQYNLSAAGESSLSTSFDLGLTHDTSSHYNYQYDYQYDTSNIQN